SARGRRPRRQAAVCRAGGARLEEGGAPLEAHVREMSLQRVGLAELQRQCLTLHEVPAQAADVLVAPGLRKEVQIGRVSRSDGGLDAAEGRELMAEPLLGLQVADREMIAGQPVEVMELGANVV